MSKKEKPIVAGQQDPSRCIRFPKNDTFFIVRRSVLNVVKSLDFGEKNSDFKSYGCAAAMIQYFMNNYNNTLDYLKSKPSDYVVTDSDFEDDCSKSFLTDVLLNEWVDKTVIKARDILVLNKIIKIRVHSTKVGRITKGRFEPDVMQLLINQYGIIPLTKGNDTHTKGNDTLTTKGNNTHTKGNNTHTKGNNTHTKGNDTHISISKESIKESIKEVCSTPPQKNQISVLKIESDSLETTPFGANQKKSVVNLVNYSSQTAFSDELTKHMSCVAIENKDYEKSRVGEYSAYYAGLVFGRLQGLKTYKDYGAHLQKLLEMGILRDVNVLNLRSSSPVRGEGALSHDMKSGALVDSINRANANLKYTHSHLADELEGF